MLSADPDAPGPRTDTADCPACSASPGRCAAFRWLHRRYCCDACSGDHGGQQ